MDHRDRYKPGKEAIFHAHGGNRDYLVTKVIPGGLCLFLGYCAYQNTNTEDKLCSRCSKCKYVLLVSRPDTIHPSFEPPTRPLAGGYYPVPE